MLVQTSQLRVIVEKCAQAFLTQLQQELTALESTLPCVPIPEPINSDPWDHYDELALVRRSGDGGYCPDDQ